MKSARLPFALVTSFGLAVHAGCSTNLEIGEKPGEVPLEGSGSSDGGGSTTTGFEASTSESTSGTTGEAGPSACELLAPGPAADPAVQWGLFCGGSNRESIGGFAVDVDGSTYVALNAGGSDESEVQLGDDVYSVGGDGQILLLRIDTDGAIVWSRALGTTGTIEALSLAVCDGQLFMAGQKWTDAGPLDFGDGPIDGGAFVASFADDGTTQWTLGVGEGPSYEDSTRLEVTCSSAGDVAIHGRTDGTIDFGGGPLDADPDDLLGSTLLAVLDASGTHQWSQMPGASAVSFTPAGSLVAASEVGGFPTDIVLASHDTAGAIEWQQQFVGAGSEFVHGVQVDASGSITLAGRFNVDIDLGGGALLNQDPPSDDEDVGLGHDVFVATFDAAGVHQWSTRLGTTNSGDNVSIVGHEPGGVPVVAFSFVETSDVTHFLALPGGVEALRAEIPKWGGVGAGLDADSAIVVVTDAGGEWSFAPAIPQTGSFDMLVQRLVP